LVYASHRSMQQPPNDPSQRFGYQPPGGLPPGGVPPGTPPPFAPPPGGVPPVKGWTGRKTGLAVGLGCLVLLMMIGAFGMAVLGVVGGAMRTSDAYRVALSTASANPAVVAELGAPVEAGWLTSGGINVSGSTGHANLSIPISGPLRAGRIHVVADKAAGKWLFSTLSVAVDGRPAPIDLLPALPAAPP
jgi:hypothetical protein